MPYPFAEIAFTQAVRDAQSVHGSGGAFDHVMAQDHGTAFGPMERAFLAQRDSFYLASVNSDGWPYLQHRGGPAGFVKVLDDQTLGFADFAGNRQYISLGNLTGDDRVSLFFMDYAGQRRLKMFCHATPIDADDPRMAQLVSPGYRGRVERGMILRLAGLDWNCPQHITERFTLAEVEAAQGKLLARIADLETRLGI